MVRHSTCKSSLMGKRCGIKTTAIMVQIHSLALTAVCGGSNPPGAVDSDSIKDNAIDF